jgi:hypothetical protein
MRFFLITGLTSLIMGMALGKVFFVEYNNYFFFLLGKTQMVLKLAVSLASKEGSEYDIFV